MVYHLEESRLERASGRIRSDGRPLRIVIIDDSETIRAHLSELLESIPRVEIVGEAAGGNEGMKVIQTLQPDLITLDLRMSGGNGLDLLRRLQKLGEAPEVIVLTNYATPQYEHVCRALGAHAFLDKSTQFTQLRELVERLSEEVG